MKRDISHFSSEISPGQGCNKYIKALMTTKESEYDLRI